MSGERVITVTLTEDEALAVCDFFSYGATRGNHPEVGNGPGPLTGRIQAMGLVVNKVRAALDVLP